MTTAIISGREYSEKAAARKSFETIHDALVRSQNEAHLVVLKEVLNSVGTKLDDVAGAVGVAHEVRLDTELGIAIRRVRPEDVDDELLFDRGHLVHDFKRSPNLFNLFETDQRTSNAAVQAYNSILDDSA